jgi:hypothetical protein
MKPVPRVLVEEIQRVALQVRRWCPWSGSTTGELYLAVFIDEGKDWRVLDEYLFDAVMDSDEAHGIFTMRLVRSKQKWLIAGMN